METPRCQPSAAAAAAAAETEVKSAVGLRRRSLRVLFSYGFLPADKHCTVTEVLFPLAAAFLLIPDLVVAVNAMASRVDTMFFNCDDLAQKYIVYIL